MKTLIDIIVPVRNEESNVVSLVERIHTSLTQEHLSYTLTFIDDHSTDNTIKILRTLQKKFPLQIFNKEGKRGKAYSILEGAQKNSSEYVVMIDADLQYPPEIIPKMYQMAFENQKGIVVANRRTYQQSFLRHFVSRTFKYIFGNLLLGLTCDVQSGLKLFKREIIEHIDHKDVTAWTLDVPLLYTALQLGHEIGDVEIDFVKREHGQSKLNVVSSAYEIGSHAVKFRFKEKKPITIHATDKGMLGAGVLHKRQRFITHSSLDYKNSALHTFTLPQKTFFLILGLSIVGGLLWNLILTAKIVVAVMSFIYFADVLFNFYLIWKSLHSPPEISPSMDYLISLKDKDLPIYTVLCPLYKEAHILPHFLEAVAKMDWPKNKLDVLLLLEEDDKESIVAATAMDLPSYVRVLVVPDSQPKTKPKACNYGLNHAKGEYLVIYDAEDIPDPLQLKKVFVGFQQVPSNVKCLQAKLNYHNPHQNLLTRFFTAEYSLWFDVILTGLQSIQTTIPLGGTSNHFRTQDLLELKGWDPFNVTEDCDLGMRLFNEGGKTAIVDSTTLEEANSSWHNWLRQRSRWIKGYMQTYLIHMRHPVSFFREQGIHAVLFQLIVGGKIAFMLINPFMWVLTISYFALYAIVGETIETLFPSLVFYMAAVSLLFGNFLCMYYYMIGCAKREHWSLMKYVFLIPIYWLAVSVAASIALYQLIVKPHYWEKTLHGLHLQQKKVEKILEKETEEVVPAVVTQISAKKQNPFLQRLSTLKLRRLMLINKRYISGVALIIGSVLSNVLNFAFNVYLGRELSIEDFGVLSLFSSFSYIVLILFSAIMVTVNQRAGYLFGKYGQKSLGSLWFTLKKKFIPLSLIVVGTWLIISPLLMNAFQIYSVVPLVLFTPVWFIGIAAALDRGILNGKLYFGMLSLILLIESGSKLLLAIGFNLAGYSHLTYLTIPLSQAIAFGVGRLILLKEYSRKNLIKEILPASTFSLSKRFFVTSVVSGLSTISFLSLDVILVKHFLTPTLAGEYALISLVGKMVFFLSSLATQFVLPIVSRNEGANKSSIKTLWLTFVATLGLTSIGVLFFGVLGEYTLPFIFKDRIVPLVPLILIFSIGTLCFSLSRVFEQYYLAKNTFAFSLVSFLVTFVQVGGIYIYHQNLEQVVMMMTLVGFLNLFFTTWMHFFFHIVRIIESNLTDLFDLFIHRYKDSKKINPNKLKILFFNWRDTKHVWAGGAEEYMHQIAKELVQQGHKVTIFSGNDGHHARNEVIDGIQVVRRGGTYTVYFWAFIYYVLRFRGLFDVVIDCENGIPFLTPLYVKIPKFLIIHHIHQEVFRSQLRFPLSHLGLFIESVLMPLLYKNQKIITVSESTRKETKRLGLGDGKSIEVINPGIDTVYLKKARKTQHPSISYVGRLKPYKNIDVALRAFTRVLADYPEATFTIAGEGESFDDLKKLAHQLEIHKQVFFVGKVSEKKKAEILGESWIVVQPSMIEGWGITVIEANACGTPVIASNVAGLRDSVIDRRTGLLIPAKDIRALAVALDELISQKELRKEFSQAAYEWSKNFSWNQSAHKFIQIVKRETLVTYNENDIGPSYAFSRHETYEE